jgi:hypothetical protein
MLNQHLEGEACVERQALNTMIGDRKTTEPHKVSGACCSTLGAIRLEIRTLRQNLSGVVI